MKAETVQELIEVIEKEVKIHNSILVGESQRGKDYEDGFIDGIKHVKSLINILYNKK